MVKVSVANLQGLRLCAEVPKGAKKQRVTGGSAKDGAVGGTRWVVVEKGRLLGELINVNKMPKKEMAERPEGCEPSARKFGSSDIKYWWKKAVVAGTEYHVREAVFKEPEEPDEEDEDEDEEEERNSIDRSQGHGTEEVAAAPMKVQQRIAKAWDRKIEKSEAEQSTQFIVTEDQFEDPGDEPERATRASRKRKAAALPNQSPELQKRDGIQQDMDVDDGMDSKASHTQGVSPTVSSDNRFTDGHKHASVPPEAGSIEDAMGAGDSPRAHVALTRTTIPAENNSDNVLNGQAAAVPFPIIVMSHTPDDVETAIILTDLRHATSQKRGKVIDRIDPSASVPGFTPHSTHCNTHFLLGL